MCYSGCCEYEFKTADQDCGCSKPIGELCPHEQEAVEALGIEDFETEHDDVDTD